MKTLVWFLGALKTMCFPAGTVDPHSAAVVKSPTARRPRRVPTRLQIRRTIFHVYVVVLVISNGLLLYVGGELVDLYVSSIELWAELARKHLEITL
jgi:hypothetical protein